MEKLTRRRYTLEYKQGAVGLVTSGQRVVAAAKALGIVEQTLANWVKAEKAGQLRGVKSEQVSTSSAVVAASTLSLAEAQSLPSYVAGRLRFAPARAALAGNGLSMGKKPLRQKSREQTLERPSL
jgi:transposase